MKKLKYNLLILLILQILIAAKPVQAEKEDTKGGFEVKKEYHKTYPVNSNTGLDITNKYGDITIKDWDKNEISIDVIIKVTSSTKEKADKKLESINVKFWEENSTIKALTDIGDIDNNFISINKYNNQSFSIKYEVNMPKNLKLTLNNKYGDIFINDIQGKTAIVLKYGNLKANKLMFDDSKPLSKIELSYSDANIINSNWIEMIANYSDITIENNTALILASKYSDIKVGKSVAVVTNSKYDDYKLGVIVNFVTTSKYTDIEIAEIADKFDIDSDYGNIKVKATKSDFSKIKIISKYTDIRIPISISANYSIKGNVKYGDIKVNSGFEKLNKDDSGLETTINGINGKDTPSKATITINAEYGDIDLTE